MTEEQKAEKYAHEHYIRQHGSIAYRKSVEDVWLDGYHEGFKDCAKARLNVTTISDCPIKDEWHDLEKDPTDYPEDAGAKLVVIDYGALGWEYGIRANMNDPVARKDVIKWKEIE